MAVPGSARRVDRLGNGAVAELVGRVGVGDVEDCLRMLTVTVVDIVDLGGEPVVREVLTQWREQGRVSPATRSQLAAVMTRHEVDAAFAHRSSDIDGQRLSFVKARALHCLSIAIDSATGHTERLGEAAYEAAAAMGGTAGVVAVLVEFAA
ncbi:hypothetical protein QNM97_15140 [Gordonia sp. L191]|uniref:hypothetical protein n=1 Tax=Gordonia sp. L191 TaxID=2982699 RepID=UPI0024C0DAFB|nr:hypothetical protein [Gordonia sp. L191]WHU45362.1 hypothetical protein QNM97_15140 [Gordonia sp. L191]